jgi:hypothetical protein
MSWSMGGGGDRLDDELPSSLSAWLGLFARGLGALALVWVWLVAMLGGIG